MSRILVFVLTAMICLATFAGRSAETISLADRWQIALDRKDAGLAERWFAKALPENHFIKLPGILEAQGYGDRITAQTPWVMSLYDHFWFLRADYAAYTNASHAKVAFLCQPQRHYLGAAWYQKDITIPADWGEKRVTLFLERPHWKTTVWLDERETGSEISLCTPHEFDFGRVPPGKHRLTIRVDNRMILPYRADAHSVSDSLDNAWNGIAGRMELRATWPVWLDDVQVYPDLTNKLLQVTVRIGNQTGIAGQGSLAVVNGDWQPNGVSRLPGQPVEWTTNGGTGKITIALGNDFKQWDEFQPHLEKLTVVLRGNRPAPGHTNDSATACYDTRQITYGLRDFHAEGNQFMLNGRPVYLRGTHFGGDFPLTGYPPTEVAAWKKIFRTCQDWGLNHLRFHSWCPPEAAFTAADELGFYLQVECGMWNQFTPGGEMEKMLFTETERIIKCYGNHPSFLLLSASNEAGGHWKECLPQWVKFFRHEDPRRLYTPNTGWSLIDEPGPVTGADFLAVGRIGGNRVRGESGWFGRDYGSSVRGVNVPVVAHELGQWCAYPDFSVISKFTGFMQPGNYEIFRDSARANGLLARNQEFARASGRFQLACYKEEIEANLRTPGLGGFQLLDLHDYTGQGTALVGLLDPFWETKGYATAGEFKKFCGPVVPLARLKQRTFISTDPFSVPVEVANYGPEPLTVDSAEWQIVSAGQTVMAEGRFDVSRIPLGKNLPLGNITADLATLPAPASYCLRVTLRQASPGQPGRNDGAGRVVNDWNFWVYPAEISGATPAGVLATSSWPEAEQKLSAGGKVLYTPRLADLSWDSPPLARVPIFWNALMGPTWGRMLGLWCNTNSPALAGFPTATSCDWQWTELVRNARAINLNRLPRGLTPIVSAIDDWNRNDRLGVIFEARIGRGKLLVCAIDLDSRPGAQQLRRSLLDYMAGDKFAPATAVSADDCRSFLFDNLVMRKLGATITANGKAAGEMTDGDPNTYWCSADARGNGPKPPHEITVSFATPVALRGLSLVPRQNHREHQGDIHEYRLEQSDDGVTWQAVTQGVLASTFAPQTINFGKTITTRQLRLTVLSGFGTDKAAALAELAVIYAGPKLPENAGSLEYQRVRTASTDIDAGVETPSQTKRPKRR